MKIEKYAQLQEQGVSEEELVLINKQTMRPLSGEEVFAFRVVACDTKIDRDHECFSRAALETLSSLFVGRTVIGDHKWSSAKQSARIYAAEVQDIGKDAQLILRCYMLRTERTQEIITSIEGGILREVSVGCRCDKAICSVCDTDRRRAYCGHIPGQAYEKEVCHITLDDAQDAYELSFVAVPAQPGAGIIKRYGGAGEPPQDKSDAVCSSEMAQARQALEERRYGGIKV